MEYENVVRKGLWHKAIDLGNKEMVVVHNPQLIVHYQVGGRLVVIFNARCTLVSRDDTLEYFGYVLVNRGEKSPLGYLI